MRMQDVRKSTFSSFCQAIVKFKFRDENETIQNKRARSKLQNRTLECRIQGYPIKSISLTVFDKLLLRAKITNYGHVHKFLGHTFLKKTPVI